MRKVYLDHGATTPLNEEVLEVMLPFLKDKYGNPSSMHFMGREARKALEEARERMAVILGASPWEIIFTSGGTEADSLAVLGAARSRKETGNHIITTGVEHHAVLDACRALQKEGFEITLVPVDRHGMVDPQAVEGAIQENTVLVTIMYANNEVGTVQPLEKIGEIARSRGILLHTDAVQCPGSLSLEVEKLKVDLLALSAHKFYGPKGVGALYVRRGTSLDPLVFGGGQERGRRAGTENVPGIIGMARALEIVTGHMQENRERMQNLRDRLTGGLLSLEGVYLNGHPGQRLPGNVNMCFDYIEGEALLLRLDGKGIAASSGSACSSGSMEPSHVLTAMGLPERQARGSLRFTLGIHTTAPEIDYLLQVLPGELESLRYMSPVYQKKGEKERV